MCWFLHQNINEQHWLSEFVVFAFIVFFEGFLKCPFESTMEARGDISNELQLAALHRSSEKWCRTLYMIGNILIIRLNVKKNWVGYLSVSTSAPLPEVIDLLRCCLAAGINHLPPSAFSPLKGKDKMNCGITNVFTVPAVSCHGKSDCCNFLTMSPLSHDGQTGFLMLIPALRQFALICCWDGTITYAFPHPLSCCSRWRGSLLWMRTALSRHNESVLHLTL